MLYDKISTTDLKKVLSTLDFTKLENSYSQVLRDMETKVNREEFEVCYNGIMESKVNITEI